jgi:hypothetical protein
LRNFLTCGLSGVPMLDFVVPFACDMSPIISGTLKCQTKTRESHAETM